MRLGTWDTLKTKLGLATGSTTVVQRIDGKWLHIRKSAQLNQEQAELFRALGLPERISPLPGPSPKLAPPSRSEDPLPEVAVNAKM